MSAADRDQAGGMPVFIVDHQLLYHSAGPQYWLHAYHIELAGIITPTAVPEAVRKDKCGGRNENGQNWPGGTRLEVG